GEVGGGVGVRGEGAAYGGRSASTSERRTGPSSPPPGSRRVTTCYSVFDAFFPRFGFFDLTEGIYEGPDTSYEAAQANQHDYLLDQLPRRPGLPPPGLRLRSGP